MCEARERNAGLQVAVLAGKRQNGRGAQGREVVKSQFLLDSGNVFEAGLVAIVLPHHILTPFHINNPLFRLQLLHCWVESCYFLASRTFCSFD